MAFTDAEKQKNFTKKSTNSSLLSQIAYRVFRKMEAIQPSIILQMTMELGSSLCPEPIWERPCAARSMDEKPAGPQGIAPGGTEELTTYVNSNFQAINNSIMLGGSYNTKDPCIHLDVSEYMDHNAHHDLMRGEKAKKSEKGGSKSHHHNEHYSD